MADCSRASRIAAEVTQAQLQHDIDGASPADDDAWQALLRKAAKAANSRVYEESRADAERKGMGTTLTIALIVGERLHIASVGDSRAYLLNAAGVTANGATTAQLTSDHSLVARLVDIVRGHPYPLDAPAPELLIVSPPPLTATANVEFAEMFGRRLEASRELAAQYSALADEVGCGFFDAGSVACSSELDGVHLDAANTRAIGEGLAPIVRVMLEL